MENSRDNKYLFLLNPDAMSGEGNRKFIVSVLPLQRAITYLTWISGTYQLMGAHADGSIGIFHIDSITRQLSSNFLETLSGVHSRYLRQLSQSKGNSNNMASAGNDGAVCIWDLEYKSVVASHNVKNTRCKSFFFGLSSFK